MNPYLFMVIIFACLFAVSGMINNTTSAPVETVLPVDGNIMSGTI